MIVSPPKAGKTTLLKQVALSVQKNNPEIHLLILLIDERPEEVTDIRELNFSCCVLILVCPCRISPVFRLNLRICDGDT